MRVAILEPHPNFGGGMEAFSLALAEALDQRGHAIYLLHNTFGSMMPRYERFIRERVNLSLIGYSRRKPFKTLTSVAKIGRACRALNIDVGVSSHLGFIPHAAGIRYAYGVPFCFHLGLPNASPRMRFAYPAIAAGVAPSRHTAESWLTGGWPLQKLHVIPNWVDTERFRPVADRFSLRSELSLPTDGLHIVYVGRIAKGKGVSDLLDAFALLTSKNLTIYLILVGGLDPQYSSHFHSKLSQLTAQTKGQIIVKPATDCPEKYFAAADLACIPSNAEESFGLTLIEAMASSLPVVATKTKAFSEIMGNADADTLVPMDDAAALAAKMELWLTHANARRTFGKQLRDIVLLNFTASESVAKYEAVLSATLYGRTSP